MKQDILERRLQRATGRRIQLVVTNNRRRMLTYTPSPDGHDTLRLNRIFLDADEKIQRALSAFLRGNPDVQAVLQDYVDRRTRKLARGLAQKPLMLCTQGRVYDLQAIFDTINRRYFKSVVDVSITWGRRRTCAQKASVQLGTYSPSERLIRINPVLDDPKVPHFVIEKIVYHEMLHHVVPPEKSGKRMNFHSAEFRNLESLFPYAEKAEHWIDRHLSLILR